MKSEEKISVIIPIYKVEKYLKKCIESILVQTYRNLEIILVDDGSPDRCGQICDEFATIDNRIKVIHKKNGGLSDARNVGLDIITGDYISFIDSDDFIERDMLEKLYSACKQYSVNIAGCDLAYVYENKNNIIVRNDLSSTCLVSSLEFFRTMIDTTKRLRMGVWNKLYKSELFKNVRFPKGKLYEDVAIMYKVIFQVTSIAYVHEPLYYYLKRDGAITSRKYDKHEIDRYENTEAMLIYILENQPLLYNETIAYKLINANLSIVNSMIDSNCNDKKMILLLKKDCRKYFIQLLKSKCLNFKKLQVGIFNISFVLYKITYKLCKKFT